MKRSSAISALSGILIICAASVSCKKTDNPVKYPNGSFPDSVIALSDINSEYDDYNCDTYKLFGDFYLLFSTNRGSSGGQFDFEQAEIKFTFDQTTGEFKYSDNISSLPYLDKLIEKSVTDGNDFGPYSIFSTVDGYEYHFTASENPDGNLDFYYFMNFPVSSNAVPNLQGPFPAILLNTDSDDAYICFNADQDSAYFSSSAGGDFDIYVKTRPGNTSIDTWLSDNYSSSNRVDSINSIYEDKCPVVYQDIMLFASNRPGGMGGYDLYYSVFRNSNWSSPVNLGPHINTAADEFRPRLWWHNDFTNDLMIFSSNRSGGKGGFDLYFTGIDFSQVQ